jgi:hypothetical protein
MKIDPNKVKTRDPLMVAIINGATKSGTHKDRRKEANRKRCRQKVGQED